MNPLTSGALSSAPPGKLIDFDHARLSLSPGGQEWFLIVAAPRLRAGWRAALVPRVYRDMPDYWRIDCIETPLTPDLAEQQRLEPAIPLTGITGRRGVCVVGATRTLELSPPPVPSAYRDRAAVITSPGESNWGSSTGRDTRGPK